MVAGAGCQKLQQEAQRDHSETTHVTNSRPGAESGSDWFVQVVNRRALRNQPPNSAADIPKSLINLQSHKIISPLGLSQIVANQSQDFAGDSFIPGATSEPFRNFRVEVVCPFLRQFEHFFKVSQGLLVSPIILIWRCRIKIAYSSADVREGSFAGVINEVGCLRFTLQYHV